ncbi:GNAT family N-acetyltransferase [Amycolatopsis jiangsuensis]|uniref:GNAT superfamily N-acetyltransferase n=1 Tax=Amycolatopsis jiangsuensis TaxID=1181879 RepID=A0A840J492_9PSEU|nr:GNAT family N-acetyltransferase [Amycolatopsis jiangsuensis]MBB4688232.1 GNAT superfamily N-acetyltransferase [Amycolatopsis jiangsuensis]
MPPLRVEDLRTSPQLRLPALALGAVGGSFLRHDPVGELAASARLAKWWPEFFLVLLREGVPVARAAAVPVAFPTAERPELPDHGWDGALLWAAEDTLDGRPPTALVALEVYVAEAARGLGVAAAALGELKNRARRASLSRFVVPVRPTGKTAQPFEPMADYLARRDQHGRAADPWLRRHEQLGAWPVKIAPFAMTVTATLAQWEQWTGIRLGDGCTAVPGGIAPVLAAPGQDLGVYVEPNVWFEHPLSARPEPVSRPDAPGAR